MWFSFTTLQATKNEDKLMKHVLLTLLIAVLMGAFGGCATSPKISYPYVDASLLGTPIEFSYPDNFAFYGLSPYYENAVMFRHKLQQCDIVIQKHTDPLDVQRLMFLELFVSKQDEYAFGERIVLKKEHFTANMTPMLFRVGGELYAYYYVEIMWGSENENLLMAVYCKYESLAEVEHDLLVIFSSFADLKTLPVVPKEDELQPTKIKSDGKSA